jgi:two-component system LytT family response regulator
MKLRALVVDDEALARGRLRNLLAAAADVDIVGECSNGPEAITALREQRPDLVFLDVQMPEVSGFEVLRAVPRELWPAVIFVTAHDQHAVQAFEVDAVDYLLKPFTQARLLAAVERARQQIEIRNQVAVNQQAGPLIKPTQREAAYLKRIAVKSGAATLFIPVEEVDYLESAGNYVVVHTRGGNHVLRETLTSLEERLSPSLFLRISRSILVSLQRVKSVQATARGEYLVVLQNDIQLLMTRGVKEIQDRLQYPDGPV